MNIRQQKYKKNRLIGMNPENAAVAAGFSVSYARAKAYRIEKSAKIGMADVFERAGLTDKAIVTHALEGLKALKLQSCNIYISKPNTESIDADRLIINKNSNDFVEVEDWNNRHKYFETILKLSNKLRADVLLDQSTHKHFVQIYLPTQKETDGLASPAETRSIP